MMKLTEESLKKLIQEVVTAESADRHFLLIDEALIRLRLAAKMLDMNYFHRADLSDIVAKLEVVRKGALSYRRKVRHQ